MGASDKSDRATQASPQAPTGLGHSVSIPSADKNMTLYCSFCGHSQHERLCLIAGPTVLICDICIENCQHIIFETRINRAVKEALERAAQGTSAGTAETEGLGAKPAGPVLEEDAPNTSPERRTP